MRSTDQIPTFFAVRLVGVSGVRAFDAAWSFGSSAWSLRVSKRDDPQGDLIRRLGKEHEARYLERLRVEGREVVEVDLDEAGLPSPNPEGDA